MKKMMFAMALLFASPTLAEEKKPSLPCGKSEEVEKILNEKGYTHLLDLTSSKGSVQSFWAGGKSMVITMQHPDKKEMSCLIEQAEGVTYNPITITQIYNALQKSQKGI